MKRSQDNVEAVLGILSKLSPEDRAKLNHLGISAPVVADDGSLEKKYGYICHHCGQVALVFVGSRFQDQFGNVHDIPVEGMSIDRVAWTYEDEFANHKMDRHTPKCQHCHTTVALLDRNIVAKRVVSLERHRESRKNAEIAYRAFVNRGESGPASLSVPNFRAPNLAEVMERHAAAGTIPPVELIDKAYQSLAERPQPSNEDQS